MVISPLKSTLGLCITLVHIQMHLQPVLSLNLKECNTSELQIYNGRKFTPAVTDNADNAAVWEWKTGQNYVYPPAISQLKNWVAVGETCATNRKTLNAFYGGFWFGVSLAIAAVLVVCFVLAEFCLYLPAAILAVRRLTATPKRRLAGASTAKIVMSKIKDELEPTLRGKHNYNKAEVDQVVRRYEDALEGSDCDSEVLIGNLSDCFSRTPLGGKMIREASALCTNGIPDPDGGKEDFSAKDVLTTDMCAKFKEKSIDRVGGTGPTGLTNNRRRLFNADSSEEEVFVQRRIKLYRTSNTNGVYYKLDAENYKPGSYVKYIYAQLYDDNGGKPWKVKQRLYGLNSFTVAYYDFAYSQNITCNQQGTQNDIKFEFYAKTEDDVDKVGKEGFQKYSMILGPFPKDVKQKNGGLEIGAKFHKSAGNGWLTVDHFDGEPSQTCAAKRKYGCYNDQCWSHCGYAVHEWCYTRSPSSKGRVGCMTDSECQDWWSCDSWCTA